MANTLQYTPGPVSISEQLDHEIGLKLELIEAADIALNRLNKAWLYGTDMLTSKQVCIEDAIKTLREGISKARGQK